MLITPTVAEAIKVLRAAWSRRCTTTRELALVARLPPRRCAAVAGVLRGEAHDTGAEVGCPHLLMWDDDDAEPPALTLAGRDMLRCWERVVEGRWPDDMRICGE